MTAWVNLFAHGPLRREHIDPPLGRAHFAALTDGLAQAADASLAPVGTELLWYEVQPGKTVGYERANKNGTLRTADSMSPTLEGKGFLLFGDGWKISLIDRTPT
jgi:hypothetical protein